MIISHITSIQCAYAIIESGQYKPVSTNPLHGDAGLNCLNGSEINHYENNGVVINFNWSGPVIKTEQIINLPNNNLINNGPWRLIVPTKTDKYLSFCELQIIDKQAYEEFAYSMVPWFFRFLHPIRGRVGAVQKLDLLFLNNKGKKIIVL